MVRIYQLFAQALGGSCASAMFLLGDQPLVTVATIEKLILAFHKEPERWVEPSWDGQRENPVIIPASWFDKIITLKGDTGPKKYLKDPSARLKLVEVDDRGVVFDIDSPEDNSVLKKYDFTISYKRIEISNKYMLKLSICPLPIDEPLSLRQSPFHCC